MVLSEVGKGKGEVQDRGLQVTCLLPCEQTPSISSSRIGSPAWVISFPLEALGKLLPIWKSQLGDELVVGAEGPNLDVQLNLEQNRGEGHWPFE